MAQENTLKDYYKQSANRAGETGIKEIAVLVPEGDETILTTITGKGKIVGGLLKVSSVGSQKDAEINIRIDGHTVQGWEIQQLNNWGITPPACMPARILSYDDATFVYTLDFLQGILFNEEFRISIMINGVDPATCNLALLYEAF